MSKGPDLIDHQLQKHQQSVILICYHSYVNTYRGGAFCVKIPSDTACIACNLRRCNKGVPFSEQVFLSTESLQVNNAVVNLSVCPVASV